MDGLKWIGLGAIALMAGCGQRTPPPFPDYAEPGPRVSLSANAFQDYIAASELAERSAERYLTRVSFTPGQKEALVKLVSPAMNRVASAGGKQAVFPFEPMRPFESQPHRQGWRLIGQGMAWRITDLVEQGNDREAVRWTMIATRFGFDLTGGGATDAALGFTIVDEARAALLPALSRLDAATSAELAAGLDRALKRRPDLGQSVEYERLNMRMAIQDIQDAYQKSDFALFREKLGPDIQPAIVYLRDLRPKDATERTAYFDSMADEADAWAAYFSELANRNARQRESAKPPELQDSRPWRRWSRFFFRASEDLFPMQDRTIARTRLMGLHAWIRAQRIKSGSYPATLGGAPENLQIDPHTGSAFAYRTAAGQYRLYSVGADFRDDGGETNETFSSPDLKIEDPSF